MKTQIKTPNLKTTEPVVKLTLVEIHDTDLDSEVGGQDLPFKVTVKVEGMSLKNALVMIDFDKIGAFNVQESKRLSLPEHLEFLTFSFKKDIQRFFGVTPEKTEYEKASDAYYRLSYVRTVGELREAIADLPADFPLVHSQEYENRQGMTVHTGEWAFKAPGMGYSSAQWSLRLEKLSSSDWLKLEEGNWKNVNANALRDHNPTQPNSSEVEMCFSDYFNEWLDSLAISAKNEINSMSAHALQLIENSSLTH